MFSNLLHLVKTNILFGPENMMGFGTRKFQLQTISTSYCSFPSEDLSSKLINLGTRTTFLALGKNVSHLCAVDQVIHILETERIQTIVKLDIYQSHSDLIEDALKKSKKLDGRV